ncbi:hypothetical protein [Mucilaginibacter sp.]|uniref:hypothetical protein n=1 Tax=Mucilaginibacter sp. TaxID=1882438 RepID=UPI0032661BFF
MKRKLAVIVLFVYSVVTCKAMAQTVALAYYFNHETHTASNRQTEPLPALLIPIVSQTNNQYQYQLTLTAIMQQTTKEKVT